MPQDVAGLHELLKQHERALVRYAQSIVGELETARDVVQETFIKWVESRKPVAGVNGADGNDGGGASADSRPPAAWLFTVCRNLAIDHQRRQRRIVPMHPLDDLTSEEPGPDTALASRETAGSLLRLLEELSENQREVIRLKFQNDLSYKEIAAVTQLSVTNVGFLLHTGLKRLRTLVLEQPQDDFPLPLRQTL